MTEVTILDEFDFVRKFSTKNFKKITVRYCTSIAKLKVSDACCNWIIDINPYYTNRAARYNSIKNVTQCRQLLLIHDVTDADITIDLLNESETPSEIVGDICLLLDGIKKMLFHPQVSNTAIEGIVKGKTAVAKRLYHLAELVAPTDYSVILYGETGTGKEIMAKYIHSLSTRKNQPFIALDCGCLNKEIAASELFGHVKGAFTDAASDKTGAFEMANNGTLFLDEIGNLSYETQLLLLRCIQEQCIRKVGSIEEMKTDVRIIVASNENLLELAKQGKFREDLYHRLNELLLVIPPLRERMEDLPLLVDSFLNDISREIGKEIKGLTPEARQKFQEHSWNGNIRELKNVLKYACLLTETGSFIDSAALPFEPISIQKEHVLESPAITEDLKTAVSEAKNEKILDALKKAQYNKGKAADILNIHRKTLYNKLKTMGIEL